jgi:hypothetical protein
MTSKNYHVVPADPGGWSVKREGADRASSHHDTQADAINAGKQLAQNSGGELRIQAQK